MAKAGKLAIVVGGGPAPGINSVIAAASIRAAVKGIDVLGIQNGFRSIMRGDISETNPLPIETVSRIHFRGGSILGTARDNPTKSPETMDRTLDSFRRLGVDKLITIGGDDTAYTAARLEEHSKGTLKVVHVPKTIDNDLALPHGVSTFGYQTARHEGVEIVKNLMIDAKTTGRWYLVISMGRKAGHLALGIGKAAGATVTIIPEEFREKRIRLSHVADIIVGTIAKRLVQGRVDGVVILAEGLMERFDPKDLEQMGRIERDQHGNIRLGEFQFAPVIRQKVMERLEQVGVKATVTTKDIGYELRCAEPIPYDLEYTRDLGFCAAQFIINGGNAAMVSIVDGHFRPLYFKDIIDKKTGRTRIRMVRVDSEYYHIARRYMLRIHRGDFEDKAMLASLAALCHMTPRQFRSEFEYLIEKDRLNQVWEKRKTKRLAVTDVMAPF
jgi:6-phosphofructokinase